jgi:uncharacterized protein (TIGR03118 family)
MNSATKWWNARMLTMAAALVVAVTVFLPVTASAQKYQRVNLVSDIPGVALRVDPNLINPWGVAFGPGGPIWIANNNSGTSTLYQGDGTPFPVKTPLVVNIPGPTGAQQPFTAAPTGIVFNGGKGFVVSQNGKSGAALFIFATEDGTISGWSPGVNLFNAVLAVDNSSVGPGAVYKGLAISPDPAAPVLFAANFRGGVVEMYDTSFKSLGSFTDVNLPNGFAPFGVHVIGERLFVTFALQNQSKHDDVGGAGNGFVDIFDLKGNLLRRFASNGTLNSPWGVVQTPEGFGHFDEDILVGNFKDGRINAFNRHTGQFKGQLLDTLGNPLTIQSLWTLKFADGGVSGKRSHLLFTAGIGFEQHGLFGFIRVAEKDDLEDTLE